MPTETGRIIKRKRINLPTGGTVDVPVVAQITFLDVVAQGQEYEFHVENSSAGNRDVHVATVPGGGAATDESGGGGTHDLKVERIDIWRVLDVVDRGQESFIHLDNKTVKEPPDAPPYFTTHENTHIVKYINTPDDGAWIKSELIDRFKVLDVVAQGQETEYFLFNPPDNSSISGLTLGTDNDGTTVAVDPGIEEIADALDPVRTDPFQNIVDWSHEGTHPPLGHAFCHAQIGVTVVGKGGGGVGEPRTVGPLGAPTQCTVIAVSVPPAVGTSSSTESCIAGGWPADQQTDSAPAGFQVVLDSINYAGGTVTVPYHFLGPASATLPGGSLSFDFSGVSIVVSSGALAGKTQSFEQFLQSGNLPGGTGIQLGPPILV